MQEEFYQSKKVDKQVLKELMKRSDQPTLRNFLIQYALFLVSAIGLVVFTGYYWLWLPCFAGFAFIHLSLFALGHETSHSTAFKSKKLNEIAAWCVCLPTYYTPTMFKQFHFEHHRFTHIPGQDPEISFAGESAPSITSNIFLYMFWLTGIPMMSYKAALVAAASIGHGSFIWEKLYFFASESSRAQIRKEARIIVCFYIAYIACATFLWPPLFLLFAGQLVGNAIISFYTTTEHNGLPHEGEIVERTRSTRTNPIILFFMWNMPYHTEHHSYPAVPWHALPKLKEAMDSEILHTTDGHPGFHGRVVKQLIKNQPFKE